MTHPYSQSVYNAVRHDTMKDGNQNVYRIEDKGGIPTSFVDFVRIFSDKISTELESTALVAYLVHAFHLNYSITYGRDIIDIGLSLITTLPTQYEVTVEGHRESQFKSNSAHFWFASSDSVLSKAALTLLKYRSVRELKISSPHDAMSDLLTLLHASERRPFQTHYGINQTWSCFPFLML